MNTPECKPGKATGDLWCITHGQNAYLCGKAMTTDDTRPPWPTSNAEWWREHARGAHGCTCSFDPIKETPEPTAPAEGLEEWTSPAVARRAEIARNAELRRAATAYLAHLDTDQGEDNSIEMLEWAAAEDHLREALRAALTPEDE